MAKDGHSLIFFCATRARSFDENFLKKIMKDDYCKSSSCVVSWDDTSLEMMEQKVHPKNGVFWGQATRGAAQVEMQGHATAVNKHDYPTEYSVKDKRGKWHVQCNCIVLITVKRAEDWVKAELEVKSGYVNLFWIDSSQSQDGPPSPPP